MSQVKILDEKDTTKKEITLRKRETTLTKELGETLRKNNPRSVVFCNRCPSKSSKIRKKWYDTFRELSPPLQPEMDLIIWEPQKHTMPDDDEKLRAIEIKYFRKTDGKVNQSFYKGIEQSLALLQWGFDNVALWQLFDETFSDMDLSNYGGRTWLYVHNRLNLPIDYTMIGVINAQSHNPRFLVVQIDWDNFPEISWKRNLEIFPIKWNRKNPFRNLPSTPTTHPLLRKFIKESKSLRTFLLDWLRERQPKS